MKIIMLTQGKFTTVDDEDYEELVKHKWCLGGRGKYAIRRVYRTCVKMANVIMKPPPGMVVDHISGDTLDDRRCNLRVCTEKQNHANRAKKRTTDYLYKGVEPFPNGRWRAVIFFDGKKHNLGTFTDPKAAAMAYDTVALHTWGEYARLNLPDEPPDLVFMRSKRTSAGGRKVSPLWETLVKESTR